MKKQLIKEAFRLQQIAGLRPVNEILPSSDTPRRRGLQREEVGQAQTTTFSPQDIKSVSFANGTSFTVGDIDMEGGIVISIEKTSTGFEVSGYGDGEGYTYYYDMQGNEIEAEGMSRSMQKEYITSAEESITEAFQKAGIDLKKPVICISDFGSHSVDAPKKISGGKLLQDLEAERVAYLEQDPDFDQTEGIQFEYGPEPGDGLLGDDEDAVQGLACKLIVLFSDSHLYEIWQAKGMSRGMQKEQEGGMNRRGNTKTYYTVNRYGVTEIVPLESLGFDGSEQWEEISGFDSDIIKKYYTDNDGTGKVVVDANTSEEEMLADLERIDDDLWM